jgi:hypothetical protein
MSGVNYQSDECIRCGGSASVVRKLKTNGRPPAPKFPYCRGCDPRAEDSGVQEHFAAEDYSQEVYNHE